MKITLKDSKADKFILVFEAENFGDGSTLDKLEKSVSDLIKNNKNIDIFTYSDIIDRRLVLGIPIIDNASSLVLKVSKEN